MKNWLLVKTYMVQMEGENKEPDLSLLTDAEFAAFVRNGNWDDDGIRYEVFEIKKRVLNSAIK